MADSSPFDDIRRFRHAAQAPASSMMFGTSQPPPIVPTVTPAENALENLERAIENLEKAISKNGLKHDMARAFFARSRASLKPVFGEESKLITKLSEWTKESVKQPLDTAKFFERVSELKHFALLLRDYSEQETLAPASYPSRCPTTKSVFIIHGHDELNWRRLADALRNELQLEPVVIWARPGQSQTTIEKFESEASKCAYAIALFTPDDGVTNKTSGDGYQARPNVVFEAGWFLGRLGRNRLLLLVKEGTILHSDFAGVNQIPFHDDVTDKFLRIKQELQAAGMV